MIIMLKELIKNRLKQAEMKFEKYPNGYYMGRRDELQYINNLFNKKGDNE